MLRKSSPEELPGSNFLLISTFVFFLLSQIPVGIRLYESLGEVFQLLFLDVILLSVWLRIIVQLIQFNGWAFPFCLCAILKRIELFR